MVLEAIGGLLGLGGSPPSVRRATLEVQFGGNAPAWRVRLVSARVTAGLLPSVDHAEIAIVADADAPTAPPGTAGDIKIGYDDSTTDRIFSGQISAVGRGLDGLLRLTAVNGGAALAALRLNRSYEAQKAGDVVRDLAGTAGVPTGTIEAGISLPFLFVDDGRSALQHIAALARLCGYIAYLTPDGKLECKPFGGGQPAARFAYGQDILALSAREVGPPIGEVTVQGEGAAGAQGSEAWNWLVKDPSSVRKAAGSGAPKRSRVDRALRSADAAGSAAEGNATAAGWQAHTGVLRAAGAPAVVPGAAVEIAGAPDASLNGLCLVRWVCHEYTKRGGLTTTLGFAHVGAAGGSGGLLETLGSLL